MKVSMVATDGQAVSKHSFWIDYDLWHRTFSAMGIEGLLQLQLPLDKCYLVIYLISVVRPA